MKTKSRIWFCSLIVIGFVIILAHSCKKDVYNPPYMTDHDGNAYTSVTIGTQVWMVENLKTTKYNDGSAIPLVTDEAAWAEFSTPGYCWYGNDAATYKATYGALYNWYVVDSASNGGKNVCPSGWHVPSDAEWTTLTTYLGGDSVAGGKLKETGNAHWTYPNTGATNEAGFTALPGGRRNDDGSFDFIKGYGYWWSSTEYSPMYAYVRDLIYNSSFVPNFGDFKKYHGLSIRCLRDN